MTREFAMVRLIPAIGLAIGLFSVLMMVVLARKRKHFSPFFVFRAYLLFAFVLAVGGWMIAKPLTEGYDLPDIVFGFEEQEDEAVVNAPPGNPGADGNPIEAPGRRRLPEMSSLEAEMVVRNLQSSFSRLQLDALDTLSRRRPSERDRQAVLRALRPLTHGLDVDGEVRAAANKALADLR